MTFDRYAVEFGTAVIDMCGRASFLVRRNSTGQWALPGHGTVVQYAVVTLAEGIKM